MNRLVAGLGAVALLAGCATTSGVRAAPAASAPPSTTVALPGEVFSPDAAHAKQVAMLALVAIPAGSTQLAVSPTTDLTGVQTTASDNFLDLPTWYSVPMSRNAYLAFLVAHPPQGFSYGGGGAGPTVSSNNYVQTSLGSPDAQIIVSYRAIGADQVDIRVDAQVIWLPVKTPAEMIPPTLKTATLAYTGPMSSFGGSGDTTPKPKHKIVLVTGAKLRRLVAALNAQTAEAPFESNCPADFGETAAITMHFGGQKVVDRVDFSGCGGVYVTADGKDQPGLTSDEAITNAVYAIVGVRRTPIPIVKPQGPPVRTLAQPFALQHNKVQAQRVGDRALGFGGEFPQDARYSPPVKSPTKPPYFGKGTLVDRAQFETVEGKMADLVSWFRANPGPGNVAAEPYQEKHGIRRLDIEPKDRAKRTTANVWISMVQKGNQVVFRIDAQTAY